jgi:RNA-splicing ligase RtcB
MSSDADAAPAEDKLDKCRTMMAEWRDKAAQIEDHEAKVKELRAEIQQIRDKKLVDLFDETGIDHLGIPANGNLPPLEIEINDWVHANIPEENMEQAAAWMIKTGNEDLIKTEFKISYGLGEKKDAIKFEKQLIKMGEAYDKKQGVPWNTLTAFIKSEIKAGRPLTKKVMGMLGAESGRVATIVKQKKGKK